MGTYYTYNCSHCGASTTTRNKVLKCVFCGSLVCKKHYLKGYCPTDDIALEDSEKNRLRSLEFWKRSTCFLPIGLSAIIVLLSIPPLLNYGYIVAAAIAIPLLIVYPIITYKQSTKRLGETKAAILDRIGREPMDVPSGVVTGNLCPDCKGSVVNGVCTNCGMQICTACGKVNRTPGRQNCIYCDHAL